MARRGPTLRQRVICCERCPRLVDYRREVARIKRRAYRDQTYWGRPVPSFGVRSPRLLVVGLAPGGHGANRTGRVFTGDWSGDWLYRALFEAGFANRAESAHARDGLRLIDTTVTLAARCVPPANKPTPEELRRCRPFLVEEMRTYGRLIVIVTLGKIAFDAALDAWQQARRSPFAGRLRFGHGHEVLSADRKTVLLASYHPSRRNTQTGLLGWSEFSAVFQRARRIVDRAVQTSSRLRRRRLKPPTMEP